MSKPFLITSLVVFALLQVIVLLCFWFVIDRRLWTLQNNQQ